MAFDGIWIKVRPGYGAVGIPHSPKQIGEILLCQRSGIGKSRDVFADHGGRKVVFLEFNTASLGRRRQQIVDQREGAGVVHAFISLRSRLSRQCAVLGAVLRHTVSRKGGIKTRSNFENCRKILFLQETLTFETSASRPKSKPDQTLASHVQNGT